LPKEVEVETWKKENRDRFSIRKKIFDGFNAFRSHLFRGVKNQNKRRKKRGKEEIHTTTQPRPDRAGHVVLVKFPIETSTLRVTFNIKSKKEGGDHEKGVQAMYRDRNVRIF